MNKLLRLTAQTLITITASFSLAASRPEQIKSLVQKLNETAKGAIGKNSYQRPGGRMDVLQGGTIASPPRDTIFTAAFRNDIAAQLAALDFYVGNHFTTVYWELNNKYLATDAERKALAFHLDHARFMNTPLMAPQAQSMARHMLLEQFYMRKFPASRIAKANSQRGTADAENETTFYGYLTQYLARSISTPSDYLVLFEMQKRWNLTGDGNQVSLSKLRDEVASIYDEMALSLPPDSTQLAEFRAIRNSIHNYLTPQVGDRLGAFIKQYGASFGSTGRLTSLRNQIALYYKTDRKVLAAWAQKTASVLPANSAQVIAALADGSNSLAQLEALSQLLAQSRDSFMASRNPDVIHFMIRVNQFLQSQLASKSLSAGDDWAARARIAINSIYASGLLTQEQFATLSATFGGAQSGDDAVRARLADLLATLSNAQVNVHTAMLPAISDWALIDSSMEGFVDDTLRSSLLTEIDQLSSWLKKHAPTPANTPGYSIEYAGEAFGYLVYVPKGSGDEVIQKLDKTMIPVFAELPLDLGVVAAIITEQPQTPLSHINIKSKSRGTPNLYLPNASHDPMLKDLIAKKALVKVSFKDGKISVRPATLPEANAYWGKMKAPTKVTVSSDLSETRIRSTKDLRSRDVITVGAKAANYGEAESFLHEDIVREGLGIPFFYYKQFIQTNHWDAQTTLEGHMQALVADPRMRSDRDFLVAELKKLQERMIADDMTVNPQLVAEVETRLNQMHPGMSMRFRSSTNSEDLPNFSGAGLYDSYSFDPTKPKKSVKAALMRTWASVWNLRAFDERELFGIEHMAVNMGILVSPGFGEELANGVAVTRNTIAPQIGKGLYLNTQVGEDLVTNPDPENTPEELIVLDQPDTAAHLPYTLHMVHYSSRSPKQSILNTDEIVTLSKYLVAINNHFRLIFDPKKTNKNFAMDVEYKIANVGGQRRIFIKQARPYVAR